MSGSSGNGHLRAFVVGGNDNDRISLQKAFDGESADTYMAPLDQEWSDSISDFRVANCQVLFVGREITGNDPEPILKSVLKTVPDAPLIVFGGPEDEEYRRRLIGYGAIDCLASGRLRPEFIMRASMRAAEKTKAEPKQNLNLVPFVGSMLLNMSLEGVFAYDLNFRIALWNPRMEQIFNISAMEAVGKNAIEVLPFLEDVEEDELFIAVRQGRTVKPQDRPFVHPKTGKKGLFESSYAPITNHDGRIVGVLCLFKDVTNMRDSNRENTPMPLQTPFQKLTESNYAGIPGPMAVASSKAEIVAFNQSRTIENAPIGIWKLDVNFQVTKVNPTVCKQLTKPESELLGQSFFKLVTSFKESDFNQVLEKGERIHFENHFVYANAARESNPVIWDVAAWPLKGDTDEIVGVCLSTMEVTERRKLLQQREDFVATLVHDLKTPLLGAEKTLESMIGGLVGDLDPGQSDVLSMLKRSNQQLLSMVQNLIEFYHYDKKTDDTEFEDVDIAELLMICVDELFALAQQKEIKLAAKFPDALPHVQANKLGMKRVFINLIDNAIKFSPKGAHVEINAKKKRDHIEIRVRDTGLGIEEVDKEKLFQRFFRGEKGKRFAVGTGLGLYLCKKIVTDHKGTIEVVSKEGQGSTFIVGLPIVRS
ncbi:MAG: PAS domain-containing protein [Candidatus Obscuribacterales bacterium]|nr:PAS domain-containing protein [Candidatus Obscuribacterales bacterium]